MHARQKNPRYPGEKKTPVTAWIQALSRAILEKYNGNIRLFKKEEQSDSDDITTMLSLKLDNMAKLLNLYPVNTEGKFLGNLKGISHEELSPAMLICPNSAICEAKKCSPRTLYVMTNDRDTSCITLIQGTKFLNNV